MPGQEKTLYELGAEMREPLTSEEKRLVYEAQTLKMDLDAYQKESPTLWKRQLMEGSVEHPNGMIYWILGSLVISGPEQVAHLKIAIERAKRHFLPYGISPHLVGGSTPPTPPADRFPLTDPRLIQSPLGISPEAIHCQVELDFAKCEAQLKNALQLCSEPNTSIVRHFLNCGTSLKNQLKSDCYEIRTIEYPAMACNDEQASGMLEDLASKVATESTAIQYMGELLTVMEKVLGIREGTLTQEEVDLCNRLIPGMSLTTNIATGSQVQRINPNQFNIEFVDLRHALATIPKSARDPEGKWLDEQLERYAATTVDIALTNLFGPTEVRKIGSEDHKVFADRASLIIVDGKTVYERIQERYRALQEKNLDMESFAKWYPKNRNEMSAQIVAAGLMAGKHVEAYVPDPDGKLPDRPTQIQKTGYTPNETSPNTRSAWERYCRDLGFNETKVDADKEQRALMDARERLRAHHHVAYAGSKGGTSTLMRDMFFGRYMQEHGLKNWNELSQLPTSTTDYRLGRCAPVTTCICMMAANGYSLQDILDPTKLLDVKHQVAQTYMRRALKQEKTSEKQIRDGRWLGSVLFHGQRAILKQIDAMMKNVNLKEPQQRKEMTPILFGAASAMLDIDQEKDQRNAKAGYMAAAERIYRTGTTQTDSTDDTIKKDAKNLATEMVYQASDVAYFLDTLFKTDVARLSLASPYPEKSGNIASTLSLLPMEQCGLQRQTENTAKGMPFRQAVQDFCIITSTISQIAQDKAIIEASQQLDEQSKNWEVANANGILAGSMDDEFLLDIDFDTFNVSIQRSSKSQNDLNQSQIGNTKLSMSPVSN